MSGESFFKFFNTFSTIFLCFSEYTSISFSLKDESCSGERDQVPVPLQGASTIIPSYRSRELSASFSRSNIFVLKLLIPALAKRVFRFSKLFSRVSVAKMCIEFSFECSNNDLPPLPAQASHHWLSGSGLK